MSDKPAPLLPWTADRRPVVSPSYKHPVIAFGIVAPLLILFVLLEVVSQFRSGIEDTYRTRKEQYVEGRKVQKERDALRRRVKEQGPRMNLCMALVETPPGPAAKNLLNELQKRYPVQFCGRLGLSSGGIGSASKQPSRQLRLSFRGTYRDLQNTFCELETSMPQLQLDQIRLKQETTHNLLTADVTYTAWQRE